MSIRGHKLLGGGACACLLAALAAGVGPSAARAQPLVEALTGSNINRLVAGHPRLRSFFNHRRVYPLGNPQGDQLQARGVPRATPTLIYHSYARFTADVAAGRIDPRIQAVAYDPERWRLTPSTEQRSPAAYMQLFGALARAHGLRVIETPARDLMEVGAAACHAAPGERLTHAYLRCGLPAEAARDSDIIEVQSQVVEFSLRRFGNLLAAAGAQARAANPRVIVLAGVSTRPPSGAATFGSMVADARSAARRGCGLWVNVFSQHPHQRRVAGLFFHWLQLHGY